MTETSAAALNSVVDLAYLSLSSSLSLLFLPRHLHDNIFSTVCDDATPIRLPEDQPSRWNIGEDEHIAAKPA